MTDHIDSLTTLMWLSKAPKSYTFYSVDEEYMAFRNVYH